MPIRRVLLGFMFAVFAGSAQLGGQVDRSFDPPDMQYTSVEEVEIDGTTLGKLPVGAQHRDFLPAKIDLTHLMPLPGNQGHLKSCTAWATAYAARSYYGAAFEGRNPRQPTNIPSPAYVYHLGRGAECGGSSFVKMADVLKRGALSLAAYPYTDACVPPPGPDVVAQAHDFRVRGVTMVNKDKIDDLKGQLARSNPVLISFHDSPGWHRH